MQALHFFKIYMRELIADSYVWNYDLLIMKGPDHSGTPARITSLFLIYPLWCVHMDTLPPSNVSSGELICVHLAWQEGNLFARHMIASHGQSYLS